jgi:hypothetical protein
MKTSVPHKFKQAKPIHPPVSENLAKLHSPTTQKLHKMQQMTMNEKRQIMPPL